MTQQFSSLQSHSDEDNDDGDESHVEDVADLDAVTPRREAEVISNYIQGAFTLNDNALVAEQLNKEKDFSKKSLQHRLSKAVEKTQNQEQKKKKQELVQKYKIKESSLTKGIDDFLVSKYGHTGDPPPKQKSSELIQNLRRQKKKINDGQAEKKEEELLDEPVMTKKELIAATNDVKYMSGQQQMKRFSQYLNQSFFMGADAFIKTKHQQFLKSTNVKKPESVFERLEKDKKLRDQKVQEETRRSHQNFQGSSRRSNGSGSITNQNSIHYIKPFRANADTVIGQSNYRTSGQVSPTLPSIKVSLNTSLTSQ